MMPFKISKIELPLPDIFAYLQTIPIATLNNPRLSSGLNHPQTAGDIKKGRRTIIAFILAKM